MQYRCSGAEPGSQLRFGAGHLSAVAVDDLSPGPLRVRLRCRRVRPPREQIPPAPMNRRGLQDTGDVVMSSPPSGCP